MDSSDWQIYKLTKIKQINITGYDYSYSHVFIAIK